MKIVRVQSFLMSYPLAEPLHLEYYGGDRLILKRDAMLIRVETDSGLTGYAPGQGSESAKQLIDSTVAPFLEGRSLADPDALRIQFQRGPGKDERALKAYCSVEIALYDLAGKAHGVPVSELLGGRVRDRIRLYGSAGMYQPPGRYAEEALAISKLGFRAYKMRPALGPEKDVETVRLMRQAVGPDFDLMVDAHSWWRMGDKSYDYAMVEQIAAQFAEDDIAWLEEPLPPHDHDAYRRLKATGFTPLASGEHEPGEPEFLDLIENDCVDYVQMDVICQGGYPVGRRLLPEIAKQGLRFAFHCWGTDLEVIAAAQLGVCWPDTVAEWLEYPCYTTAALKSMYPFPLAAEILKVPLEIDTGDLIVPRSPGLGIEVDESVIERYPWIPGPWSRFSTHSPSETWAVTGDHSVRWTDQ